MKIGIGAAAAEDVVTKKKLPAAVQGGLITVFALDGAGSYDRGIEFRLGCIKGEGLSYECDQEQA